MNSIHSIDGESYRVITSWFTAIYREYYEMESTSRSLAEKRDRECSLLLHQKQLLEHQIQEADLDLAAQREFICAQTEKISVHEATAAITHSGPLQTAHPAESLLRR